MAAAFAPTKRPAKTSVHPRETKQHRSTQPNTAEASLLPTPSVEYRHRHWHPQRLALYEALLANLATEAVLDRFRNCGANAWVVCDTQHPRHVAIRCTACKHRLCQPCAQQRSKKLAAQLIASIGRQSVRFVTLTLKAQTSDLGIELTRLYKCFTKLRRTALWKTTVTGGIAFAELKAPTGANAWHPHLHCVVVGDYIPQPRLRAAWLKATGNSTIVDVRLVRDPDKIAPYVAKYATKGIDKAVYDSPDALQEAVSALKGRRLVLKFGTMRKKTEEQERPRIDWRPLCKLDRLLANAAQGVPWAVNLLALLEDHEPCHRNECMIGPTTIDRRGSPSS